MKIRNILRKASAVGIAVLMTTALMIPMVSAAGYTYTVTVYSGNGTFGGGATEQKIEGIEYGKTVSLADYVSNATPDNEKYYAKGVHVAGDEQLTSTVTVKGDMEFVVAYGIKGQEASYVVHYVDVDGNTIHADETGTGYVGQETVVSYVHIDGYQPAMLNETMTLGEGSNEFTFIYRTAPVNTTTVVEEVIVPVVGGETAEGAAPGANGEDANAAENGAEGGNAQANPNPAPAENVNLDETTPEQVVEEQNQQAPLDNTQLDGKGSATPYIIGGGIGLIAIIAIIIAAASKKKRA